MIVKYQTEYQKNMIKFISDNRDKLSPFKIKFIYCDDYIFEDKLPDFTKKDIIIWNNELAGRNLDIVKRFQKSVVLLPKRTILTQKQSKFNPITENMAINHDFKIMYISNEIDITNEEWSLVIDETNYVVTIENLITL